MAVDYGVRQGLLGKGYNNDDIGYDQNTGYVQLKGQNFIKPEMNIQGTTYTSQDNFNNSYDQYNKQQKANQQQQLTDQYIQKATQDPVANPYNDQYSQLINTIMQKVNAPQQDVYSTPQYAAAQGQQQRAAQQGIRSAQEALGSAGFGRSTALGESANRAQNDANEYLQLQMVPQIQQQLAAQRQAEIGNQMGLLNPIFNQVNRQDTLDQTQNQNLRAVIDMLYGRDQNSLDRERQTKNDNLNAALQIGQEKGRVLDPKSDWSNLYNQTDAPLTFDAQQKQIQNTQNMAQLTGYLPDGNGGMIPTSAEQQRQLGNLWTLADQSGTIPNELADMYGIPRGTQTQSAKQFAMSNALATDKYHSDVDQSLFDSMTKAGQTPKGADVSGISANINRGISSMGSNFDASTPEGKQQIESMIITQTHDPKVAVPLYNMYGIQVPPQLQKEYEQSLKANQ